MLSGISSTSLVVFVLVLRWFVQYISNPTIEKRNILMSTVALSIRQRYIIKKTAPGGTAFQLSLLAIIHL